MDESTFQAAVQTFAPILGPDAQHARYDQADFWGRIGQHPLDLQITALADFCLQCSPDQRMALLRSRQGMPSWHLVCYVRRLALQLLETPDQLWLQRGLAIACLENAEDDYRDSIVSLVILRAAAEQVGLDTRPAFTAAMAECDPQFVSTLQNARDHRPSDVRATLRAFGPPQLKPRS